MPLINRYVGWSQARGRRVEELLVMVLFGETDSFGLAVAILRRNATHADQLGSERRRHLLLV